MRRVLVVVVAWSLVSLTLAVGPQTAPAFRLRLVSHEYGGYDDGGYDECDSEWDGCGGGQRYDQNYGSRDDRNRNRNRNRGAFSPGPFDRSPIDFSGSCISLNCSGRDEGKQGQPEE